MNVLFVCTGNTCRSPMAAALFNKIAAKKNLDVRIESCGIFANEGDLASANAIVAMKKYDIDLLFHHSQPINTELLEKSDLILCMSNAHKMILSEYANGKVFTLSEYAGFLDKDIPDPYGGDMDEYEECAKDLYDLLLIIADKIKKEQEN